MRGRLLLMVAVIGLVFAWVPLARGANAPTTGSTTVSEVKVEGSVTGTLWARVKKEPFHAVATLIFFCAVAHTFMAGRFLELSNRCRHRREEMELQAGTGDYVMRQEERERLLFREHVFHFMGEVEAVFGIWLVPLALAMVVFKGWSAMAGYVADTSFAEPVFVVVVMAISASRPVLRLAESVLARAASLGGGKPWAWWVSILTLGPLLGSFITEPAAMTICALLLGERIYALNPSARLKYATLGLLFVNISVGGTLTHFAAPPVVMVAHTWEWGFAHMLEHFGWKAVIGILISNGIYFAAFRGELMGLAFEEKAKREGDGRVPVMVTLVHVAFIAWTVLTAHYPPLVVFGFLFFMAYLQATEPHQEAVQIRGPLLVGFFLASLVMHGGCQQWWIEPVLGSLSRWPLMIGSTLLTAVNDNAAITYLASLVPEFTPAMKYAVMAGAVTGGGLTVIANAPNPAGLSILQGRFGEGGISPKGLFLAALVPTVVVGAVFMLL